MVSGETEGVVEFEVVEEDDEDEVDELNTESMSSSPFATLIVLFLFFSPKWDDTH